MTEYKRLTVKRGDGETTVRSNITIQVLINRLAKLEDEIESGELREAPRGAVILTLEERKDEMKAAREERVEFERRIELLNNELNKGLFEHKAFIEKTAIEVVRLKAEKEQVVKEFAEKLKSKKTVYDNGGDGDLRVAVPIECIEELLKEYVEQLDEFADCKTCSAWSGSDCTRNPYTEGCLKEE